MQRRVPKVSAAEVSKPTRSCEDRCPLAQYLLERFIEVEAVPKSALMYQPPEEKQRGVFRLVRSAAGDFHD